MSRNAIEIGMALAAKQFGLGNEQNLDGAYIAQLTAMRKDTVAAMINHMEAKRQRHWRDVLIGSLDFSEYVLYGVFVDEILGGKGHRGAPEGFCHSSWFFDIETDSDIARFVREIGPHQFAVHLQSNLNFDPLALEKVLLRV